MESDSGGLSMGVPPLRGAYDQAYSERGCRRDLRGRRGGSTDGVKWPTKAMRATFRPFQFNAGTRLDHSSSLGASQ